MIMRERKVEEERKIREKEKTGGLNKVEPATPGPPAGIFFFYSSTQEDLFTPLPTQETHFAPFPTGYTFGTFPPTGDILRPPPPFLKNREFRKGFLAPLAPEY